MRLIQPTRSTSYAVLGTWLGASLAFGSTISLTPDLGSSAGIDFETAASGRDSPSFDLDMASPASLPAIGSLSSSTSTSSSTVTYDLQNDFTTQAAFDNDFAFILGHSDDSARFNGAIRFVLDTNANYAATGFLNVADNFDSPGTVAFQVSLYEDDSDTEGLDPIMISNQISSSTSNESFIVGGDGGDSTSGFFGSTTGILLAGVPYTLTYASYVNGFSGTDGNAEITGNANLTFTPVPEPGTGFGILAGVGLLMRRRRRL